MQLGKDRNIEPAVHLTTCEEVLINERCQESQHPLEGRHSLGAPVYHRQRNSTKETQ